MDQLGEHRKDTIKKLEMENEVDTPNNDTGNKSVSSDLVLIKLTNCPCFDLVTHKWI